jgi:hypothetical protein
VIFEPDGVADVGAYLTRLIRLDPSALVRLRPASRGVAAPGVAAPGVAEPFPTVALWARLPFDVLVTRHVRSTLGEDSTVRASELLTALGASPVGPQALPPRRDSSWRWPLPSSAGRVVERLPAAELRRVGAAAAGALREAAASGVRGRAVGERVLRDALLDHVPIVVHSDEGERVEVPQRLVQAVVRMGFLGSGSADAVPADSDRVAVRLAGAWVGLAAEYGTAWYRSSSALALRVR